MNTARHDHFRGSLHSVESVRVLESALVQARGISTCDLMEQAGRAVFDRARANWPEARRWCVVCGSGNNGGDGYVVARLAHVQGFDVTLIRVGESEGPAEARAARAGYAACGGSETSLRLARTDPMPELIIDALFGIGLDRAASGESAQAIEWINDRGCPVFSIDVPSGLNADTGATPGACVRALMTLSLVAWKRGQFTGRARAFTGVLQLAPLGADVEVQGIEASRERLIAASEMRALLQPRARDAHKGDHGHVLVVGGDQGMGGATLLAAESALRSGAGWVSLATRAEHLSASLARCPEVMVRAVLAPVELQPMLARADVVLLGPGLGPGDWGRQLLLAALASGKPLVLDADALNLIAGEALSLPTDVILTPHPGEAARLLGTTTALVEHDRYAAVRDLQARYGGVAVLKGAGTLICDALHLEICERGNPGMASAGMGDVLAGIIAALRAQGLSTFDAARTGVFVHASAGDLAAGKQGERGLVARDLMAQLAPVLNP
ncbi:MAG: NAD(P)H-hydrate dehydratase [Pseudomonadota bacterium]|nr:NAD(P)H-hydrate dehydratase [Pseudomonadota bacterium]